MLNVCRLIRFEISRYRWTQNCKYSVIQNRARDRERERQTSRDSERQKETESNRQKQRVTDRERDRETERKRDKTEKETEKQRYNDGETESMNKCTQVSSKSLVIRFDYTSRRGFDSYPQRTYTTLS